MAGLSIGATDFRILCRHRLLREALILTNEDLHVDQHSSPPLTGGEFLSESCKGLHALLDRSFYQRTQDPTTNQEMKKSVEFVSPVTVTIGLLSPSTFIEPGHENAGSMPLKYARS